MTGAASGIGLGLSRRLVAAGARVVLADLDEHRLHASVEELARDGQEGRR